MKVVLVVFCLILSRVDFLTSGGVCILACREVNICPEGRRKTALAWSFSEPSPFLLESPSQDAACGLGQVTRLLVLFPVPTRGRAVLGAVWGAAEVLGVRRSVPVHPLWAGHWAQRWVQPPARPVTDRGQVARLEWSGVLASEAGTEFGDWVTS